MATNENEKSPSSGSAPPSTIVPAPPDDAGRRRFLGIGIGALGLGLGGVILAPAVPVIVHPLRNRTVVGGDDFIPAGSLKAIRKSLPVSVELFADRRDAWNREEQAKIGSAWIVDLDGELVAFSTVCPHLGCAVDYDPRTEKFRCPCHKSAFSKAGAVEAGPSPRPLDRLALETKEGLVKIRYARFRQGVETKEPI